MTFKIKNITTTYLFYLLILVLVSTSCHTKKNIATDKIDKNISTGELFEKLKKKQKIHEWYTIKSSAKIYMDRNAMSGTAEIRIHKDRYIWMSIRKFGFEVARVFIRPDSFFVLNRFEKEYFSGSIKDLKYKTGIPLNFNQIQELLVLNMLIEGQKPLSYKSSDPFYMLKTTGRYIEADHKLDADLNIIKSKIKAGNETMEISLDKYKQVKDTKIPFVRKYSYPNELNPKYLLKLKIKKVIIDVPKKIKFEIPDSYEKV